MRLSAFALFITAIFLADPLSAQQRLRSVDELNTQIFATNRNEPQNRRQFYQSLERFCLEFASIIPTNTPAEQRWIENELRTTDGIRISRALSTIEWQRSSIHNDFNKCLNGTVNAVNGVDMKSTRLELLGISDIIDLNTISDYMHTTNSLNALGRADLLVQLGGVNAIKSRSISILRHLAAAL